MAVLPFDVIYRDYDVEGMPASGPHHPFKEDLRDTHNAHLAGPFPDNRVIRLNNANTGTANNIVVSASVAIPPAVYQVLYVLNVTQENTGPVNVSGAINREVVTNTSRQVPAGYFTPGMAVLCIDTGTTLRMLSYGDMEAIVKEAERAQDAAEAARDIAAGYASDAVSQGNVPIYGTMNGLSALEVPIGINSIMLNGRSAAGDGDGGQFIDRYTGEDDTAQSGDGRTWWRVRDVSRNRLSTDLYKASTFNYETIDEIRGIQKPALRNGLLAKISGREFRYQPDSHLIDNAVVVLKPEGISLEDPGRWVMQPGVFGKTFEITFGVAGSGADFTDLEELLRFCSRFRPEYAYGRANNGRCINVRILSGTVITQGIALARGQDLGHVRLTSEDPVVKVNFPTDVWWAYAEYNSRLPLFSTIFDMQGIGYDGLALKHGSSVCFEYLTALDPFAGIINAARHNVFINTDCHGAFRKGCFTGAVGDGIHLEKGCQATAREALVSGCGGSGVYLLSGCTIDAHMAKAFDCNWGIRAELGSTVGAFGVDVSSSKSYGLYAVSGTRIAAPNSKMTNCHSYGAVADGGSNIVVNEGIYSLAPGANPNGNFLSNKGSDVSALDIDLSGIAASASNFRVLNGSIMRCTGSTGTTNITTNTITSNGIIIK